MLWSKKNGPSSGQESGLVFGHQGGLTGKNGLISDGGGGRMAHHTLAKALGKQGLSTYDGLYCRSVTARQALQT